MGKHKCNSLGKTVADFMYVGTDIHKTTQCHSPQDPIRNIHRRNNVKYLSIRGS